MFTRRKTLSAPLSALILAAAASAGDPGITPSHVQLPVWQPDFLGDYGHFGHDVAIEGAHAAVAANDPDVVVTYEQIDGVWTEGQVLAGIDDGGDDDDDFASAVALHGGRLYVGAAWDDTMATDSGAVHVFDRVNGAWTLAQTLYDETPTVGGRFGGRVEVDGAWLAVGATIDDPSGSVTVYRDAGQGYELVDVLTNGFVDYFGYRFTIRARPGETTLDVFVGDHDSDVVAEDAGAVWPYVVTPENSILYGPIIPAGLDVDDLFGFDVAVDGEQLFVGAPWDDELAHNAGAVYVFEIDWDGVVPTFLEIDKILPPAGEESEFYGSRVVLADDRLAVPGAASVFSAGATYVDVYRPGIFGNGWDLDDRLTAVEWEPQELFARGLAMDAGRILVGSTAKDGSGPASGGAYLFSTAPKTAMSGHSPTPFLSQSEVYGEGKPGSMGLPVLSTSTAAVPGQTLVIGVSNLPQGSTPLLFWGPQRAELPFDGGTMLVANPIVTILPTVGLFEQVGVGGVVPDDLALAGVQIHMQAMFVDPGAAGTHQSAQTNGLTVIVGY